MKPTLVLVVALLSTLPSAAARAEGPEAVVPGCAEILAPHGQAHGEALSVPDYIFHHVADSTSLDYDLPRVHLDFRKELCRLTGWNGVVHAGKITFDFAPTKHLFFMWVAAILLIVFAVSSVPKRGVVVPKGRSAALEALVVFVRDELARKNIPDRDAADRFTPYLLTCFFFIFTMNVLGLVPYCATPTSNIAVTGGLALLTFLATQAAAIKAAGVGGYLKHLTGGVHPLLWPIMIPVEVLGLFTKPIALTIRLFANMIAGHVVIYFLIGLITIIGAQMIPVSILFALAIFFLELFVALLQAYIFTILSAVFIGMGVAMAHHEGDAH